MKIKKFNEVYEQRPKPNWLEDTDKTNYYTFTCDITVRANSQQEAEDKMEFISNGNDDIELGIYQLSYATEGGEGRFAGVRDEEKPIVNKSQLESKKSK